MYIFNCSNTVLLYFALQFANLYDYLGEKVLIILPRWICATVTVDVSINMNALIVVEKKKLKRMKTVA